MIDNGYEVYYGSHHIYVNVKHEAPSRYYAEEIHIHRRRWRSDTVTHYQIGTLHRGLEWLPVEYLVRHDDGE